MYTITCYIKLTFDCKKQIYNKNEYLYVDALYRIYFI